MDHFKFELIRASAAQEITHSRSTKFAAVTATELVEAFADFALGCGYQRESLADAFAAFTDDVTTKQITDYYNALAAQHPGQAVFHKSSTELSK